MARNPPSNGILALVQSDQDVINRWSDAAPFWDKHCEIIRQMFAPVTAALNQEGLIGGGSTVLDIATGPGDPALTIASSVGPTGRVFGIDPVPKMVEAARREARHLGLKNTQFDVARADQLPFSADTFDAVVSRFGVMFFPSPVAAVREMLRVLKPGGKLALAAWYLAEENPFFSVVSRVIERYVDSPPPAPDAPDTFRFASPRKLRAVLEQAGMLVPTERILQFTIEVPISGEDFWKLRCEMSETLGKKIATLSTEQLVDARHQALEAFSAYSADCGLSFPAKVLIVSGSKDGST